MGDKLRIVKVENRDFVVGRDSGIEIYGSEDGSINVIYRGEKFKIDSRLEIENAERYQSVRLDFEVYSTKLTIPEESNYSAYIKGKDKLVSPGESFVVDPYIEKSSIIISANNRGLEDGIEVQVSIKGGNLESKDSERDKKLHGMYEDNTSINIVESENTVNDGSDSSYFSDILNLSNLDSVEYLDRIGEGGYRDVYEIVDKSEISHIVQSEENAVIKVAKSEQGVEANKREFQTWCAVKGTNLERYFCKILNRGPEFRYIIMKKVDNLLLNEDSNKRSEIKYGMRDKIRDKIDEKTVESPGNHGFDISYDNLGKTGDEDSYKFIDYPFGGRFQFLR